MVLTGAALSRAHWERDSTCAVVVGGGGTSRAALFDVLVTPGWATQMVVSSCMATLARETACAITTGGARIFWVYTATTSAVASTN